MGLFQRKSLFISLFLLFFTTSSVWAGGLKGTVTDKQTKEPLTGATVQVAGTNTGAIADLDGNYRIDNLASGTYVIEVRYVGYKDIHLVDVKIGSEAVALNFEMESNSQILGEVAIVARKNFENEKMLQLERKQATLAIENMGAKEMSIKGAGDVQEGVKKITGISVAEAGQLVVRGLGDRYSSTTLNGLPIASPNPDNKLVPLSLFPAATVQNITVSKVYEASAFADYSGAHVDISTKENKGDDYFSVALEMGGAFNTLGKDFYYSDRKGSMFGTGNINHKYLNMSLDDFESTVKGNDIFGTSFSGSKRTASPDFGASVGGGKSWNFDNGNHLSFMASAGISNSSQTLNNAFVTTLTAQGTDLNHFDYDSYTSTLKLAGLLNVGYSFRAADQINYTLFYARNAVDSYMSRSGFDSESVELLGSNSVFHAYSLLNNQLNGSHELMDKHMKIDWSGSYGVTGSDEPDRRQVMFRRGEDGEPIGLFTLNQQETMRYFSELDEKEWVGDLKTTYLFDGKNLIRLGVSYKDKWREFQSARFYYNLRELDADVTTIYDTDSYLNFENIANGTITVSRNKQPRDGYKAGHVISALFAEANYYPMNELLVNVGLRYEQSRQTVDYYSDGGTPRRSVLEKGDLFPALNIRYDLADEHSIRLSVSRTVTRPSFVEMAPFLYKESYGSASLRGNADLKNGYNVNVDLRYDFFPKNTNDLFSVTAYFKLLQNPIERVQEAEGGSAVHSFRNADDGIAAGVEVEVRKEIIKNLRVGVNGSYMYTNVNLPAGEGVYTDSRRALQGASPYLVNVDVSYAPRFGEDKQLTVALVYNLQGPRIHTVGIFGLGNVEQETLHTLDFVGTYQLNKHLSVKLQAKDLLCSTIRFKQSIPNTGEKITVESFQPGGSADIGFTYRF